MADAEAVLAALSDEEMVGVRVLVPNMKGYERAVAARATNVLVNVAPPRASTSTPSMPRSRTRCRDIEAILSAPEDASAWTRRSACRGDVPSTARWTSAR